jgi:hypothetical protein
MYFFRYFVSSSRRSKYIDFKVKSKKKSIPIQKCPSHYLIELAVTGLKVGATMSSDYHEVCGEKKCLRGYGSPH